MSRLFMFRIPAIGSVVFALIALVVFDWAARRWPKALFRGRRNRERRLKTLSFTSIRWRTIKQLQNLLWFETS